MNWTRTLPTVEGFYWTLAKRNEGAPFSPTPEVVLVMNNAESWVYFGTGIGNEGCVDEMELWGEEPLQPPETPRWRHDHDCCTFPADAGNGREREHRLREPTPLREQVEGSGFAR